MPSNTELLLQAKSLARTDPDRAEACLMAMGVTDERADRLLFRWTLPNFTGKNGYEVGKGDGMWPTKSSSSGDGSIWMKSGAGVWR